MKEFNRYLESNFKGIPTYRSAFLNFNEEVKYDIQLIPDKNSDDEKTIYLNPNTVYPFNSGDYLTVDNVDYLITDYDASMESGLVSGVVVKTNNVINFVDYYGKIHQYPIYIDEITGTGVDSGQYLDTIKGNIEISLQYNNVTALLKTNSRILLSNTDTSIDGTIQAFKLSNVENYRNKKLLKLAFELDMINMAVDNTDLMVADYSVNVFVVDIVEGDFEQEVDYSGTLNVSTTLNGSSVEELVLWTSSNEDVVTVDSNGVINVLTLGVATIRASLVGNEDIFDEITITAIESAPAVVTYAITPQITRLLLSESQTYEVYKYIDNVPQADTFTMTTNSVPSNYFDLTIVDGNKFTVKNKSMYTSGDLIITCDDGSGETVSIDIKLAGAW